MGGDESSISRQGLFQSGRWGERVSARARGGGGGERGGVWRMAVVVVVVVEVEVATDDGKGGFNCARAR